MKCLREAREFLGISSKDPKDAIQAFDHTDRALDGCCILYSIYEKIQTARNLLRDTIILRVQCQVPMGDRSMYIAELQETIGRIIGKREFGRLMHSYKMTIGKKFPHRAFTSNAQRQRRHRRWPRMPKRSRNRDDTQRPQDGRCLLEFCKFRLPHLIERETLEFDAPGECRGALPAS